MGQMTGEDWDTHTSYNDLPDGVSYRKETTITHTDSDLENLRKQEHQTEAKEDEKDKKKGKKSIFDTIIKFKNRKNQKPQEVQKTHVAVMEMDDFYKTEMGQKVLANPWGSYSNGLYMDMKEVDRNGYAVKRGDNYFLVTQISTKTYPYFGLDIEKQYYVYFIERVGKVDAWNPINFNINIHFDCKKENDDITYSPRSDTRITTSINTKHGSDETNNDLFDKFIAPDTHWFECMTHTATRQEVLNGTVRENILESAKPRVKHYLEEQEEGQKNDYKRQLLIKEIEDRVRSIN